MGEVTSSAPVPEQQSPVVRINQQLAEWKQKGAHVLAPLALQAVPEMYRPVLVVVYIDPLPANKEVYQQPRGGGFSLSSLAWKKIGDAMTIQWVPEECGRTDDGSNPRKCCYRMVGRVQGLDGTWRTIMGDKEIDLDVIEEEQRDNRTIEAQNNLREPEFKRLYPTPEAVKAWIEDKVRQDVLQMRKHMVARAQSGAIARATKNIGIRETYTAEELKKPFVFPKLVFSPDPSNPQDRQFMLHQASGATAALYAPPPATLPPPTRSAMPPQEVPFLDPGEPEPSTPTWEEVTRADFKISDVKGQVEILQKLIVRKGYDVKKLRGNMADWSAENRAAFLNRLCDMPDAIPAPGSPAPLPFD